MTSSERSAMHRHYDGQATALAYRLKHRRSLLRRLASQRERTLLERILRTLAPIESALDCPSGAGRFTHALRAHAGRVWAVDRSKAMLRAAQSGLPAAAADAAQLPFATDAMDIVVCMRLLHHLGDEETRVGVLREAARVARRAVIVSFADADTWRGRRSKSRRRPISRSRMAREAEMAGLRLVPPTTPICSAFSVFSFVALRLPASGKPKIGS